MGYYDMQNKCKICNNKLEYRLYVADNGDIGADDDNIVVCKKCGTKYKIEDEDLKFVERGHGDMVHFMMIAPIFSKPRKRHMNMQEN